MTDQRNFYRELSAYIPQSLLTWYGSSPAGQIHRVSRLEGVLVCVDASGFTALTKKLALSGRGGSEDLTILLNIFFEKMSQTVFACDGDVLKFAGDAFWAYFPASFDPQLFMRLALGRLEEVNDSSGFTREHPLNIHVGAERGCFSLASLGDPSFRLEVEPIGPLVHTVYRACDYAGENELYAGPALGKHCQLSSKTICNDEIFFIVAEQPQLAQGVTGPASREFATLEHPQLTSYIPQEIVARLKSAGIGASLQSEHRQVVSLFAYFEYACDKDSSGPVENIERLCETLGKAFAAVRKMRGSVARIDPYGQGHKLLILFGAPQKLEQDELHAAACAREVIKLADKHISIRIGASLGPLYCGDVGAQRRREYTVMGEGANMAARLMAKAAWGQILCDERLRSKMPDIVRTERLTLALKGIGKDVPCFALTTIEEEDSAAGDNNKIIGQEFELGELKNRCSAISNGIGNVTLVTGEAGSGKTSLLTRLSSQQSNDRIFITCKNSVLYGRNWLARKILSGLHETWDQSFRGSLTEYVLSSVDRRWIPMLGDLIERPESENEWTRGLSAELRLQKLVELYLQLVSGLVTAPRRIIVDDFDRADESSQGLVYEVAKVIPGIPLSLTLAARQSRNLKVKSLEHTKEIEAPVPTGDEWLEYLNERFESGKREQELISRLLETTGGNPLCILEFIRGCVDRGDLAANSLSGKLELVESATDLKLPENIVSVHLSRFDKLPERDRQALKCAAISTGEFDTGLISTTLGEQGPDTLHNRLASYVDSGILERNSATNKFSFRHSSMREAIYSCIPESELRRLHLAHARLIEEKHNNADRNADSEVLAYHFFRGGLAPEAFTYSLLSAVKASQVYSLTESAVLFEQCAALLRDHCPEKFKHEEIFRFYFEYARFLVLEGHFERAYRVYRKWRRYGKLLGNVEECLTSATETAKLLWKQSRYGRSRFILNHVISSAAETGNHFALAGAYSVLAEIDRRMGDFDQAQKRCRRSIEIVSELGDIELLCDVYNKLGLAQWGAGKLEDAARNYEQSLQAGRETVGKYSEAQATNNLGIIHQALGRFLSAEQLLQNALELFGDIGDRRNEAYASGNLANVSRIIGKFSRADELYHRADTIFQKLNDRHAHFYTVGNLGELDLTLGRLGSAAERIEQAAKFAAEVGDKELESECHVRFGELAFFSKDISLAEARYKSAIEVARKIGSQEYVIRGSLGLARLYIGERDHDQAAELIKRVSRAAAKEKAIIAEHEAIFLTGESHRIRNDLDSSLPCYLQVLDYARQYGMFELILKSSARIYETGRAKKDMAASELKDLSHTFIERNGPELWTEVINSSYFSYFSVALGEIFRENISSNANTL